MRDIVLVLGLDGAVLEANEAAVAAYGYDREALKKLSMADLRTAETRAQVPQQIKDAAAAGLMYQTLHLRRDGTSFPVEVSTHDITLGGQRVILSIVHDITHRKAMEAELRRHHDHLDALVEEKTADIKHQRRLYETMLSNTPDFVYLFDLQHCFIYLNDALLATYGFGRDYVIGKTFLELGYEPWLATQHDREIEEVIQTKKPIRGEVPFTGTNGTRMYDYIFAPVIGEDGEVEAIAGITRDVTERRENERLMEFLFALEGATQPVSDPRIIMEIAVCMTAEHLAASRCSYTDVAADGDHCTVGADYVREGFPSMLDSYRLKQYGHKVVEGLQSGRTLVIRDAAKELASDDAGASAYNAIGVRADITCPLLMGGRLYAMMSVLQDKPRDWTAHEIQLMQAVTERCGIYIERVRNEAMLRESNRKKDEFLATLAHELRNPLAPIRNALYVMKSGSPGDEMSTQSRDLMERQVDQMVRLVDDLMDVSRITRGKIELRTETIQLADVLRNAIETATPLVNENKHALTLRLPEAPIYISGDVVRLSQIFANLLNNAAKYTKKGGQIDIDVTILNERASIRIADNGIGIMPDMLPHVFDMFSQADNSLERKHGGLGIGLTIVKRLVDLHGGTVVVASDGAEKGCVFTVGLPVVSPENRSVIPDDKAPNPVLASTAVMKVLIADDNIASGQTLAWTIELLGCDVRIANSGQAALDTAKEFLPDIVLLDIGMPDMNGYDVCQMMRILPGLEKTLFIAQTGWGQKEHLQRSKEAGFHHHLVKPVKLEDLKEIFKTHMA